MDNEGCQKNDDEIHNHKGETRFYSPAFLGHSGKNIRTRIIDVIIEGFDYAKSAMIVSAKSDEIAKTIIKNISRGATAIEARGLYKDQKREVLYTVVSRKEIGLLLDDVKKIDPDAFIIVNNVHEVLGKGFRPRI